MALPRHQHYAEKALQIAANALTAYGKWFGPYPYEDFTVAESYFGWNGNQCGQLVMIDERVFGLPQLAGGFVDYLISHEICHQWWYNVVGVNGYSETFMDEGLATYFSKRLLNEDGRPATAYMMKYPEGLEWLPNVRRQDYHAYGMYGTFGRGSNGPIIQGHGKVWQRHQSFQYGYDKGSRVMGMVEERMGSAAFLDFMRIVYCRYQYRIFRVADFRRELEAYTGHSWDEFFRDWLYGPGLTDWAVEERFGPATAALLQTGVVRLVETPSRRKVRSEQTWRRRRQVLALWSCSVRRGRSPSRPTLGFSMTGCQGYPIRIPIWPQAGSYKSDDPSGLSLR